LRHRERQLSASNPSPWVSRWYCGTQKGGRILDVACGSGRHFSMSLSSGQHVVGIDKDFSNSSYRSPDTKNLTLLQHDLEDGSPFPVAGQKFSGVIVTNYLHRPILPAIVDAVADDGILIYETFAVGQEAYGKPSNPNFLLRPGELLEAVAGRLHVFGYLHSRESAPDRMIQSIAAVGPRHRWLLDPMSM
jgi:SAM-dependent methyltransferase